MQKPFILGLNPFIEERQFLSTEELYQRVGQNTGNLAFHYAINYQLHGGVRAVGWERPVEEINQAGTIAIVPCANQLGPHANYKQLAEKFKAIEVPIVAIGLGAQAGTDGKIPEVPEGTLDWIRTIADHSPSSAPNITVRGDFTMKVLEHYGVADKAIVAGCPTLFLNSDPELGKKIEAKGREPKLIAVAAGHQRWSHLGRIEASLAHMVTATSGSYVSQSALEMVKLGRGEIDELDAEEIVACRDYACPEMSIDEFKKWTKSYGESFFDIPTWMEHYRKFDFVLGTRIHGVMLALQVGVPGLCIAHDSRIIELCEYMQVPFVYGRDVINGISRKAIAEKYVFDGETFDKNRKAISKKYTEFLTSNKLEHRDLLL